MLRPERILPMPPALTKAASPAGTALGTFVHRPADRRRGARWPCDGPPGKYRRPGRAPFMPWGGGCPRRSGIYQHHRKPGSRPRERKSGRQRPICACSVLCRDHHRALPGKRATHWWLYGTAKPPQIELLAQAMGGLRGMRLGMPEGIPMRDTSQARHLQHPCHHPPSPRWRFNQLAQAATVRHRRDQASATFYRPGESVDSQPDAAA